MASHHTHKKNAALSISSPVLLQRLIILTTILAVGLSIVPYFIIRKYQAINDEQEFQSSTKESFNNIKGFLNVQLHLNLQFSTNLGTSLPLKQYWPLYPIPYRNMRQSTLELLAISQVDQFLVAPIVAPDQRANFETLSKNYYKNDGHYPNGTGYSDFGFGVFDVTKDGTHVRSPEHTDPMVAKHDFLIPLWATSSNKSVGHLLSNSYSNGTIQTVDSVFDCYNKSRGNLAGRNLQCSTIMNFPYFQDTDFAGLSTPIVPIGNPNSIVAFMINFFSWQTLVTASIRQSFDFECSIQSNDRPDVLSYRVANGKVERIKEVNSKGSKSFFYQPNKNSFVFDEEGLSPVGGTTFTITYYSVETQSSQFLPLVALFSCLALTIFVSIIFICFIVLINRETCAAHRLLDAKRTYVRFISHEIRTPLNTIKLSIHLLYKNLLKFQDLINQFPPSDDPNKLNALLSELNQIIEESLELLVGLDENSSMSVTTLNDLINYDRIETNNFGIEKTEVSIWPLVEKTIQSMNFLAKEKNIRMSLTTQILNPSEFPETNNINLRNLYVLGDSLKLEQVVRNLVSNAIKYSPIDGEVKISAFFQPTEDPNHISSLPNHPYTQITQPASEDSTVPDTSVGSIIISVTDSGPGLSLEQQQSMFQEGVQFNPGELQSGQANGLTLWISKEIISLHHGTIRVHSHGLGFGSTFEIILRVYLQPTPPPTPTAEILPNSIFIGEREVEMPPRLASSTLVVTSSEVLLGGTNDPPPPQPQPFQTPVIQSPPRVLVVDDTPSCRKIVSRLLKSKGFVCNEAENGEVCVKMVLSGEYEYDFILLDFEMPVMNGPTAARKLREAKSEVLIIGLTGNVLPEDKEYFLDHGANAVLFKPLVLQDLLDYFHRHRSNETKV